MLKINTNSIVSWGKAKKTAKILAKKIKELFPDSAVHSVIKIKTLEGDQSILSAEDYLCCGPSGEFWQQKEKNIVKGYNLLKDQGILFGWSVFEPKPDKEINYTKIYCDEKGFYILGQWGEKTDEGLVQKGVSGDYIAQRPDDPSDVWIIKEGIFNNTYQILSN